ncbi:MAG: hypothetical protein ACE5HP_05690 [Gemmatimonadota bacterium]
MRRRPPGAGAPEAAVRFTYLGATFLLTAGGLAVLVGRDGPSSGAVAAGVATAWVIQAVAFWKLLAVLYRGGSLLRVWAGGIGARAGGLVLAFAAGATSSLPTRWLLLGYGVEILALLLLEAAWLAVGNPRRRGGERPDRAT